MKHIIEFNYDGLERWAINGGYVAGPQVIQEYIGREAFFEALKYSNSFRAILTVEIEEIK